MGYELDECEGCGKVTWCDDFHGCRVCRPCKVVVFYREILFPPIGFGLLDWQEKFLRGIYATDPETGARQYRRGYSTVPKKNGKRESLFQLAGGIHRDEETPTDTTALEQGFITITPLLPDMTDHEKARALKRQIEKPAP